MHTQPFALKAAIMGYSLSSTCLRREAKKQLHSMRVLSGSKSQFSKKHGKGGRELKSSTTSEELAIIIPALGEKLKPQLDLATLRYWNLEQTRKMELRKALRHAHLAYNFLKGNDYAEVEVGSYCLPDWNEVETFVLDAVKHDGNQDTPQEVKQRLAHWIEEAHRYYTENWKVAGKGSLNSDRPVLWKSFHQDAPVYEPKEKKVA